MKYFIYRSLLICLFVISAIEGIKASDIGDVRFMIRLPQNSGNTLSIVTERAAFGMISKWKFSSYPARSKIAGDNSLNIFTGSRKAGPGFMVPVNMIVKPYRSLLYLVLAGLVVALVVILLLFYRHARRASGQIAEMKKDLDNKATCLEDMNEERDWLVREVHHRVKNSLQIVVSLLNTQLSFVTDPCAAQAIKNSQQRMFAISLVHQKLYQSENLSEIDMVVYTHELLDYLQDAYHQNIESVKFTIDMVPLNVGVTVAVPLGLIINEAITNACKYAFPKNQKGEINISLEAEDQQNYVFRISDNGIGLTRNIEETSGPSFGKTLMAGLAKQIGATYELLSVNGVEIYLKFRAVPAFDTQQLPLKLKNQEI